MSWSAFRRSSFEDANEQAGAFPRDGGMSQGRAIRRIWDSLSTACSREPSPAQAPASSPDAAGADLHAIFMDSPWAPWRACGIGSIMDGSTPDDARAPSALLVEDDSNDRILLRRALFMAAPRIELNVLTDGHSAIDYLSEFTGAAPPSGIQKPFLVLLDIHLPRKSGWDILRWMRGQVSLASIPVAIWTSLPNPEGAVRARELGAARYFPKPRDLEGYLEIAAFMMHSLGD